MYATYMRELASFVVEAKVVEIVAGVDEAAIAELEQSRGYRLPACYRAFLQTFGKTNTHRWFDGDYASIDKLDAAFSVATYMLNDGPIPWLADPLIIPFTHHQGYVLYYIRRDQGDDPAVFCTVLGDEPPPTEPSQLASAFSIWLRDNAFAAINPHRWYQECRTYLDNNPVGTFEERDTLLDQHMQEYAKLYADFSAQCYQTDLQKQSLSGPWDFTSAWVRIFRHSDLYHRMQTLQMPIPFSWAQFEEEQ